MRNSTEKAVDFLGQEIALIEDDDGNTYVPLKRLCEILGIDHKLEMKKVNNDKIVFHGKVLPVPARDGKRRKTLCLPVKRVHSWIRGVDQNKVRPDMIQKLMEFSDDKTAMSHFLNYGILMAPHVPAEEIEAYNRECLEKRMERILAQIPNLVDRQFELLRTELILFRQVPYESERYNDKVAECMAIAKNKYKEWLANFGRDSAPDSKLWEKLEELRSLEKDYRDLHSVKDELFELCNRLKDREPELCDQLWQFCCRVHERCEANFRVIIALKEEIGCRYYWQPSCEEIYKKFNLMRPASDAK